MHVHHAHRNDLQSTWGHARAAQSDPQITLRRRALLEVAASAAAPPPSATAAPTTPAGATVSDSTAPDCSTYDLAAMRRQKGCLSILTQDGDTVQIRFRSSEGLAVQSTKSAPADDGATSSFSVYAFSSGRVQVGVNGELDANEVKAIGDLMEKVDSLASQFFSGDVQAAFSAASDLGFDSGEIAGFALRMSVKEFAQATVHTPPAPPAQALSATPVEDASAIATQAAPAPELPPPAAAAPDESSVADPDAAAAAVSPDATPASSAPGTADPAAALQQTLGDILKNVLEGLSGVSGSGRVDFSMRWKLQVMIQAVQSAPTAATDPAGTKLATDSLDRLAAAQA